MNTRENNHTEQHITNNSIVYINNKSINYKYSPLIFRRNGNNQLESDHNLTGDYIHPASALKIIKHYPSTDIKIVNGHHTLSFNENYLSRLGYQQFQQIQNNVDTMTIDIKLILDSDNLNDFQDLEALYSYYDKLNKVPNSHTKLASAKISVRFNINERSFILNFSILEYALYTKATTIVQYLQEKYKLLDNIALFSLENIAFAAVYSADTTQQLPEKLIPDWNQTIADYSLLHMAIDLKKADVVHFLFEKIDYHIKFIDYTTDNNHTILMWMIDWLKKKSNDKIILDDALLSKRKREANKLLSSHVKKITAIDLKIVFKFYATLIEYWWEKSRYSLSSNVAVNQIITAIKKAKFILKKIDTEQFAELERIDIQKLGIIKAQLYEGYRDHQLIRLNKLTDKIASISNSTSDTRLTILQKKVDAMIGEKIILDKKILKCQIEFNTIALTLNHNDNVLLNITNKLIKAYNKLENKDILLNSNEDEFSHYSSNKFKQFLNNISLCYEQNKSIPSIKSYLRLHILPKNASNYTDDRYKKTIKHWIIETNRLENYYKFPATDANVLYDENGFTPIGLLLNKQGLMPTINFLSQNKNVISKSDIIIDKNGDTILHRACQETQSNGTKAIDTLLSLINFEEFDINHINLQGHTAFDVFIHSIMHNHIDSCMQHNNLEKMQLHAIVNNFITKGAKLASTINQPYAANLLNVIIRFHWFDLAEYLINYSYVIDIDKFTFATLLKHQSYTLIVNILDILHHKSQNTLKLWSYTDLSIIKELFIAAKANNRHGAFNRLIDYFEMTLFRLSNQNHPISTLLSFYHSLDSDELKNEFVNKLINNEYKKAIQQDITNRGQNDMSTLQNEVNIINLEDDPLFCNEDNQIETIYNQAIGINDFYHSSKKQKINDKQHVIIEKSVDVQQSRKKFNEEDLLNSPSTMSIIDNDITELPQEMHTIETNNSVSVDIFNNTSSSIYNSRSFSLLFSVPDITTIQDDVTHILTNRFTSSSNG